jgi:hypothetical protein
VGTCVQYFNFYFLSHTFDVVIIEPSQNTYKCFENYFIENLLHCTYNEKSVILNFTFCLTRYEDLKSIIYVEEEKLCKY